MSDDRGRMKGWFAWVARGVAIVTLLAFAWVGLTSSAPSRPTVQPPRGVSAVVIDVKPATLRTDRSNPVTIAAPKMPAVAAAPDLVLAIPELGWTRSVKPEELRRGLREEIRPDVLGIFRIRVLSNGSEVGSRALAVAPPEEPGSKDVFWSFKTGPPHLLDSGGFVIPVYAAVERVRGGELVPTVIEEGVRLTLEDRNSGTKFGFLRVPAGQALSDRVGVPINPKSSYVLVASDSRGRVHVGPLPLSWSRNGPRLRLAATPDEQDQPGGVDAEATVGLYMTYQGRPAVPGEPITVKVGTPDTVRVIPASPLTIGAESGILHCRLASAMSGEDATVTFREPTYATTSAVRVRFSFPLTYYALTIVCGGFAVLAARRLDSAAILWWRVGIEVLIGGAVAAVLHTAILSGWFRSTTGSRLGLDVTTAVLVGMGGGLLGLTASDLVAGAFAAVAGVVRGGTRTEDPSDLEEDDR